MSQTDIVYVGMNPHAVRFLQECCRYNPAAETRADDLLSALKLWCLFEQVPATSAARLGSAIRKVLPDVERQYTREDGARYIGLELVEV